LYTERRAVLIVSRDGFILWARSSAAAFKSGIYIKTSGRTVSVPGASVAARPDAFVDARLGVDLPAEVWFPEPCQEMSLVSENYDFTLSLIQLPPASPLSKFSDNDDEHEREALNDQIKRIHRL
jgi:hypothetical protein